MSAAISSHNLAGNPNDVRALVAFLHQLVDARQPDGNQRKLHRREEAVHGHERNQSDDSQRDQTKCSPRAQF